MEDLDDTLYGFVVVPVSALALEMLARGIPEKKVKYVLEDALDLAIDKYREKQIKTNAGH